jgi:hypothetical protein
MVKTQTRAVLSMPTQLVWQVLYQHMMSLTKIAAQSLKRCVDCVANPVTCCAELFVSGTGGGTDRRRKLCIAVMAML